MVEKRKGIKFPLSESDEDKIIVSMIEFQGQVLVATQKGVYRLEDDVLTRLEFVEMPEQEPSPVPYKPQRFP